MNTKHVLGTSMNTIELTCTVSVIAGVLALMAYFAWFWHPGLSQCEAAIAKSLKAPSTYKRISADGSGGSYEIEYDAANSFGVPLRGRGHCFTTGGHASWYETTEGGAR
jgi:hypothetical protein